MGEFPPVTFERLFEFYHHWDQVKRSVDTSHQKLVGAGIEIKSNNEYFNVFIEKWWKEVNAGKKFSEFFLSGLVTGNAVMEIQYTSDGRIGNIEHIPMQTIFRIFRDQFANELKLVQIVDGVFKELDPEYFMHWMINNPDRQAFGKSEFFSVASPRPVSSKVDKFTGQPINPDRNLRSLLDAQAILQNAEVEIKEKMGKPRLLVSAPGMPRDQMNEVQAEMADPNTDQYIWLFDKPIDSKELQIQAQTRFDDYGDNVDAHIDIATGFASKVISHPGGFSYSGSQTPLDVLDQRMIDMQNDASELIIDKLLKPLAESWGFKEFEEMEVEVTFTPNVKRLTMEDIRGLDPEAVSPKEKRKMYEKLNIPLDDQLYDEYQNEIKQDKQDQKDVGMAQAQSNGFGGAGGAPPSMGGGGKPGTPPSAGGKSEKQSAGQGDVKPIKPLEAEPVTPQRPDNEEGRPQPTRTDKQEPSQFRKKRGEALTIDDIEKLVKTAVESAVRATIKANERIPLPPKAGASSSNYNDSVDLYVSQGLDSPGSPEITDPKLRKTYGEDEEQFEDETPPNAPQRRASVKQSGASTPYEPPVLDPQEPERNLMREEKKKGIDFTNQEDVGIPQVDDKGRIINPHKEKEFPAVGIDDYVNELENKVKADYTKGGTGDERINQDSTGNFKDPLNLANKQNEPAELEKKQPQTTKIGPRVEPEEGEPVQPNEADDFTRDMTGGYAPDEPDLKRLGSVRHDEPPYEKSEGFGKDVEDQKSGELNKYINRQDLGKKRAKYAEAVGDDYPNHPQTPDPPEKYHRDKKKPEDSDPRLPMEDPNPELNQSQKGQARLDEHPLFEQPTNDPEGINPSRDRYNKGTPTNAYGEEPHDLKNDIEHGGGDGNAVPPAEPVVGQSDQYRLQKEEQTGRDDRSKLPTIGDPLKDREEHPDNTEIIDQSGVQMQPGAPGGKVEEPYKEEPERDNITGITEPVEGSPDLQNVDKQDPIGEVPHDDGMLVKPEDTQQIQPLDKERPLDPQKGGLDQPAPGADPHQGQNIDQGVDPNEIDPNQLHIDPESGKRYTDLTDEQGNEVPDLRFDQTPDSDEKQPEVELENEIVTKEEYEKELEAQRVRRQPNTPQPPVISEDDFNAELDKKSTDPNEPNPFDLDSQNSDSQKSEKTNSQTANSEEENEQYNNGLPWEPVLKESEEVADSMRIQSEQVFVNPDGKVIGAPRFENRRKKKALTKEYGTPEGAKKAWDKRGRGRKKQEKKRGKVTDGINRLQERKHAIRDITNTFPNQFTYERAGEQATKAEELQSTHEKRMEEVKEDLSNEFEEVEVTGRVKETYSMLEKLARKPNKYKTVNDLQDVSGVRALCKDLKEVNNVATYIRENYDVIDEENYIQKSKGGYRSIHFNVKDENGLVSEIQVRTPNQEKWANWAHDNFYKPLTTEMKAFIESNYKEIEDYAQRMSDYYYKVDQGEKVKPPDCPSRLKEVLGCM